MTTPERDNLVVAAQPPLDPELRGRLLDGYDVETINSVFGQIADTCQIWLVCVWESAGGGGNSDFYIDPEDGGPLRELAGDLRAWLRGDPDDPETPQDPGDPASWVGEVSDIHPDTVAWDDGFHNCATEDLD